MLAPSISPAVPNPRQHNQPPSTMEPRTPVAAPDDEKSPIWTEALKREKKRRGKELGMDLGNQGGSARNRERENRLRRLEIEIRGKERRNCGRDRQNR